MADATYDVVIIGAGHNGLTAACYLADEGLDVAVFERRHEVGGGASTEEMAAPGFLCNNHAHWMIFWLSPPYRDFKLWEKGLHFIVTDPSGTFIFDDGTAAVSYAWHETDPKTGVTTFNQKNAERTMREFSRFSKRDGEIGWEYYEKYSKYWRDAWLKHCFNPPTPPNVKDPLEELCDNPDETWFDPWYQFATVHQVVDDLFDSVELRIWGMRAGMAGRGIYPEDCGGLSIIPHVIGNVYSWSPPLLPLGATHSVAHALQKTLSEKGGKYFVLSECDQILLEGGRAAGIRLLDGTEIRARKAVISNVDHQQTLFRFIGEDKFSDRVRRRAKHMRYDRGQIFWSHFAIHELPNWKALDFNPDIPALRNFWGPKDEDYMGTKHKAEIYANGLPSKLIIHDAYDSRWSPSHAPKGKHIVLSEQYAAPGHYYTEREWLRMKKEILDLTIKQWQWYAPNMTWDNIIGVYANSPWDSYLRNINMLDGCMVCLSEISSQIGRYRPTPELSGYKVPGVESLYLCSSANHVMGAVFSASGYNCYKVIAQDLGLPKPEDKYGRDY